MHLPRNRAFTLVEIVAVVALLAILTAGTVVGLRKHRENAELSKVLQVLSAIDQAKQSWRLLHPNDDWPADEAGRWNVIKDYMGSTAVQEPPSTPGSQEGYYYYDGVTPQNYSILIGGVNIAASGKYYSLDSGYVDVHREKAMQ